MDLVINNTSSLKQADVELDSLWTHTNGNVYRVLFFTNEDNNKPDMYPVTIVYQNEVTGTLWSRALYDWHRSMTKGEVK